MNKSHGVQNFDDSQTAAMPSASPQSDTFDSALITGIMTKTLDRIADRKRAYERIPKYQARALGTQTTFNGRGTSAVLDTTTSLTGEVAQLPQIKQVRRMATFSPVQEWEGHVVDVTRTHMIANLIDLTSRSSQRADEEAEIPLEELDEADVANLKPGQIFRWAIGYQKSPAGTKVRVSYIVFRRLPQWSQREVEEAEVEADQMAKSLNAERGNQAY